MFLKNGINELIFFNMCLILGPDRVCVENFSHGMIQFLNFLKHS